MSIKLICEKQQEGESATHSYGRDSLIRVSFGQLSLILQFLNRRVYKWLVRGIDHCTMCIKLCEKKWLLPVCSWGTQAQCCSWRDSEVDGEPDLVPSEDVPRSTPRAGRAASPRPSSPRSGSPPSSEAFSCSSTSWSSWQRSFAGYALAHLRKKQSIIRKHSFNLFHDLQNTVKKSTHKQHCKSDIQMNFKDSWFLIPKLQIFSKY